MQKIISIILSILMLFFGIFVPVATDPAETITVGEWLSLLDSEFGMTAYESNDPYYETVTPDNEYFAAVQIAYEWGVIDSEDEINVDDAATSEFVVKTLVNVANLEAAEGDEVVIKNAEELKYAEEISIAVANGIIELKANNKYEVIDIAYDEAVALLKKVKNIWESQKFDEIPEYAVEYTKDVKNVETADYVVSDNAITLPADVSVAAGDTIVLPQNNDNLEGVIFDVKSVKEEGGKTVVNGTQVDAEDVIESVKFEGAVSPDLTLSKVIDAQGNVLQSASLDNEGLLETAKDKLGNKLKNISFNVGKVKVKASLKDDGFDISLSGSVVDGVNLSKSYSVSNLDIQTKFDANLVEADIKEAFVLLDYDAVDTTTVSGSYTASLASGYNEDASGLEVLDQIKKNFSDLKLSNGVSKIDIFTVDIAIPNCPAVTVSLDVSICLDVYGQAQLVITSHNCKGYEIINNKGRFINDSEETNKTFTATGTAEVTVGLGVGVGILTYDLMDLYLKGGIGAYVVTNVTLPTDAGETVTVSSDVPSDVIAEATAVLDDADMIDVSGSAQFYGILAVSVGQNSLMKKVGLSKSWTIFNRDNGTFATIEF